MGADYIPEKDSETESWMRNLAGQLVGDPEGYRTTLDEAEQILSLAIAFGDAYRKTLTPGVVSSPLCTEKNLARKAAERLVRPMYQRLRTDPRIPNDMKLMAGVTASPIILAPALRGFGDEVSYVARWTTRTGESGPLGRPVKIVPPFNPLAASPNASRVRRRRAA